MLRAALTDEPDHASGFAILGPRVMIAMGALPATGLVQPGSLLDYAWRVVLPPGTNVPAFVAAIRAAFPDTGWRIRDASQSAPGVDRAIAQTSLFLTLVGLCALLVGGIGVATGVRAWLEARALTIATLRCLGASARLIFAVFLIQVMALCVAGVVIGVAAGAVLPVVGLHLAQDLLPVPVQLGVYPRPLVLAVVYGLLTAGAFALWPLARAAQIPGAALFRDALLPSGRGVPAAVWAANAGAGRAAGRHRGADRRRSRLRAVVLRRSRRDAAAVPRRWLGADGGGPARAGAAPGLAAARHRQSVPPGGRDAVAAGGARAGG